MTTDESNKEDVNLELTEEQKQRIKDKWNNTPKDSEPPSLKDWCEYVFGVGVDGRDKRARALKIYLATLDIKANPSHFYKTKVQKVELTEAHKEFIKNNPEMSSLEIAKELFDRPDITPLDLESRAIRNYKRALELATNPDGEEAKKTDLLKEYRPPRNFSETVHRINAYVVNKLSEDKLSIKQKQDIEATMLFLQDTRFLFLINSYQRQDIRDLFESSFIKYVHNKASDCNAEETDQYINLAASIVTQMEGMAELNMLKEQQANCLQNGLSVPKGTADRIGDLETNINELKSYQDRLIKSLQGERAKRVENKIAENSSVVALISAWKQEEHRKRIISYAQMKEKAVREELQKLNTMDGIKAQLFGVNILEIVPEEDGS